MHGLGNDFVILDRISYPEIEVTPDLANRIWDRHFWVGCDQILVIEPSETLDFKYRIYNQDGSEVEMCGNGARCFLQYVSEKGLTKKTEVHVETAKWKIILRQNGENIMVDMSPPILIDALIPVAPWIRKIHAVDRIFDFIPVSMGNPHAVIFLDTSVWDFPIEIYGPKFETALEIFPRKINVEFVNIHSPRHIEMRVWERGAGETLACGTGACASVVAGILAGKLEKNTSIRVSLRWGDLNITWSGKEDESVMMSGPATKVFNGVFIL